MFVRLLEVSWQSARIPLFPLTLAAFGLPLAAVQGFGAEPTIGNLRALDPWLPLFPLVAMAVGFAVALAVWNWDHQGEHVYALSLPASRWEWVLQKMGTGVVLLAIPFAAFLVAALLATSMLTVPDGLRTYALDVSVRFFYASLVAYSVMFALAAGSIRTALLVIGTVLGVFIVGQVVISFVAVVLGRPSLFLFGLFLELIGAWPGPLHVFLGDWLLVDL